MLTLNNSLHSVWCAKDMQLRDLNEPIHAHVVIKIDHQDCWKLSTVPISGVVIYANNGHNNPKSNPDKILRVCYRVKVRNDCARIRVDCRQEDFLMCTSGMNLKKYNAVDAYSFTGRCSVARPEKVSFGFAPRLSTVISPSCQQRSSSSSAPNGLRCRRLYSIVNVIGVFDLLGDRSRRCGSCRATSCRTLALKTKTRRQKCHLLIWQLIKPDQPSRLVVNRCWPSDDSKELDSRCVDGNNSSRGLKDRGRPQETTGKGHTKCRS